MVTIQQDGGGDYTGIDAAINGNNETTIEVQETWTIDDDVTATLTIDATNATTITVDSDSKHTGFAHSGTGSWYRLRHTGTDHLFTLSDNITITGVDLQNESTGTSDECFRMLTGSTFTLTDCVAGFASRNNEQDLVHGSNGSLTYTCVVTNCVFYNCKRAVFDCLGAGSNWDIDINSCSAFDIGDNGAQGSRSGVVGTNTGIGVLTVRMFNSTVHINTGVAFSSGAGQPAGETDVTIDRSITNQSTWATADVTTTITDSLVSRTWTANASPGPGDFVIVESITSTFDLRLQDNATDNDAQDLHADSTGAGLTMPSTDIVGTARPQNTNFDAGMFEVVAAAGGLSIPVAMANYRRRHEMRK